VSDGFDEIGTGKDKGSPRYGIADKKERRSDSYRLHPTDNLFRKSKDTYAA
jgi:hypothetical protein